MMTLREFWKREGFTKAQAVYLAERGLILGAVQNPFSKQWTVEAPACLVDWLQISVSPQRQTQRAALPSSAEAIGAADAGLYPTQAGIGAALLSLVDQQAPQGRAVGLPLDEDGGAVPPAACEDGTDAADEDGVTVYRSAKVQSSCQCLRRAVARQNREVCRLWLDSVELVHLFRAVESLRGRTRNAVSKGAQKVGALRSTDSLWRKLQEAMQRCHQRRPA